MEFETASGSVIGRDHVRAGKNNQDSLAVLNMGEPLIAIVCDGCSQGKFSEVGALLGAHWLKRIIVKSYRDVLNQLSGLSQSLADEDSYFWKSVQFNLLSRINTAAKSLDYNKLFAETINDFFLFTVVIAIIDSSGLYIFSAGDGVYGVNGEICYINPDNDNRPSYMSYELLDTSLLKSKPELLKLRLEKVISYSEVEHFFIGTDGLKYFIDAEDKTFPGKQKKIGPISQFWEEDRYFKNPDNVRRTLFLANRDFTGVDWKKQSVIKEYGRLPDDTTIIAARRKKQEA